MSTTTTNLGLVKPEYSDIADVQEINQNMDKVDGAVGAAQNSFAILADGNTHVAILSGQFVYVRNHDTLSEGLYNARAAIPTNGALATSNLVAVPDGGLNALKNDMAYKGITIKELLVTAIGSYSGFYAAGYRFFLLHVEGNASHMRDYMIPVGVDKFGFSAEIIGSSTIYVKVEGLWHKNGVLEINTLETGIWLGATIKLIGII